MDLGIAGKTALVCGASKGLGYGCAEALVREGVNVVIVARGAEALEAAAKTLAQAAGGRVRQGARGRRHHDTEAGRAAVFALRKDFDIVVTNAGGPPPGDFRDWDREAWIKAVDANMLTPIELIKATVDGMAARGFGRIVNITSSSVKAPIDILGLSNGARSGLTGFVAGVARTRKLAAHNVTINNLLPGSFDTDRLKAHDGRRGQEAARIEEVWEARRKKNIPAKRFGTPAEFGAFCAFLCSAQAGYMTGQNVLPTAAPTPARTEFAGQRRDDTTMPPTISSERQPWYPCGASPRKAADISAANSGVRLEKKPAMFGPDALHAQAPAAVGHHRRADADEGQGGKQRPAQVDVRGVSDHSPAANSARPASPNTICAIRNAAQSRGSPDGSPGASSQL
jgi:3-oxoacyl-[acyl-carrier protein] reductase